MNSVLLHFILITIFFIGIATILANCFCIKKYKNLLKYKTIDGIVLAKELVKKLDEDTQRYKFLADNVPCLIWCSNKDGYPYFFNQRWFDYTGLSFEEARDGKWLDLMRDDDREKFLVIKNFSLKHVRSYDLIVALKRFDGVCRKHFIKVIPRIDENKEAIQWLGIAIDIEDKIKII